MTKKRALCGRSPEILKRDHAEHEHAQGQTGQHKAERTHEQTAEGRETQGRVSSQPFGRPVVPDV